MSPAEGSLLYRAAGETFTAYDLQVHYCFLIYGEPAQAFQARIIRCYTLPMKIHRRAIPILLFLMIVVLSACRQDPEATPTVVPASDPATPRAESPQIDPLPAGEGVMASSPAAGALISELLTGVPGANNHEFIELYNAGESAVNLAGYRLVYLTRQDQEETLLYNWDDSVDIPAQGHYLLVHEGENIGLLPDAHFSTAIFEGKGGLVLLDGDGQVVDRLGWGEAPDGYFSGSPVTDLLAGSSMERLPGGELGSGTNSGDNAADFFLQSEPDPQNSGNLPTPLNDDRLAIHLAFPRAIAPGTAFELGVQVENLSPAAVTGVLVSLPLADHFTVVALPDGAEAADGRVSWSIDNIGPGETTSESLTLTAPFAKIAALFSGYYAEAATLPRAYGELAMLEMDGTAIPVAVARELPYGSVVTVEGVVTMYPGGFFAGSSSAKFYLEDESGGVQIFADGGLFDVSVNIGDRVRVTGVTELFRDSLEVIPVDNVTDIIVLEKNGPAPQPAAITIEQNETDAAVLGRLNMLEGTVARIDEFTYNYEVDLADERGNQTRLYIDKDTGISDEPLKLGSQYRVTGISELTSNVRELKPRLQSDIVEIFPPVLLLQLSGPTSVLPGDSITITITAVNHTPEPLTNVIISAVNQAGFTQEWLIEELAGDGAAESVIYQLQAPADAAGLLELGTISAVADQWPEPVLAGDYQTYIGEGVPIWAIQGSGSRSPLIGERVTAVGLVTGAFPEMDGFFLQSLDPDGDPLTSDGLFIAADNLGGRVQQGDIVQVTGRVREDAGQTILRPALPADIVVRSGEPAAEIGPVVYDPPASPDEAAIYKESLEGMLVTINTPAVVVGPSNQYGEFMLVYEKWDTDLVRRTDELNGFVMWVDDATFNTHVDQSTLPLAVARGDVVKEVIGPLTYTYGNYKIAPLATPDIQYGQHPLPSIAEAAGNQFSVATFNVENLFDTAIPHPADLPRLSEEEFAQQLDKVAQTIIALGAPVIVALQEVENIGVLQDLAGRSLLADYHYNPYLLEGNDSRGIDVGYLVRDDRATVEDFAILDAPNALFSRPPLMLQATVHLDSGDEQLILLNNHFLSLSAGELQTEAVRNNQAAWNAGLVDRLSSENPDMHIIVLGDLNSFYGTMPLDTLQERGLYHAYEFFEDDELLPYTYIYEGSAQSLDHILMSESLFERLSLVEALHTNADFPIPDPADSSPHRVSDHDPLLVMFTFD